MSRLLTVDQFRDVIGLTSPVLFPKAIRNDEAYLLLDGNAAGSLCLSHGEEDNPDELRKWAWSCNVDTTLRIHDDEVHLYRWDGFGKESYKTKAVSDRLESFYSYLRQQRSNRAEAIVPFLTSVFRRIRSVNRDPLGEISTREMLNLFHDFLAANHPHIRDGLERFDVQGAQITSALRDELLEIMAVGMKHLRVVPDPALVLRHVSSTLFQEVHQDALFQVEYQIAFEGFLPQEAQYKRTRRLETLGTFYTPPNIVRSLVRYALQRLDLRNGRSISILDPACGTGEFLKTALHELRSSGYSGQVSLHGMDVSQKAIDIAQFVLKYEAFFDANCLVSLQVCNSLDATSNIWPSVDLVLMNPPFKGWEMMDSTERSFVAELLRSEHSPKPNMASGFLRLALKNLNERGVLASVLPSSFFESDSYETMRKTISQDFDVQMIGRLGSHSTFSEALVDAGLFVCTTKHKSDNELTVLFADQDAEGNYEALRALNRMRPGPLSPIVREHYSLYQVSMESMPASWNPKPYRSYEMLMKLSGMPRVKDLFRINQGVRTGMNAVFLVTQEYYDALPQKEKRFFRPAVTNDSIQQGQLIKTAYVFYPYGSADIGTEAELKRKVPTYYADKLKPAKALLSSRARKAESNYWRLSEHRNWQVERKPRLLSKEFGAAGSFAFDESGDFVAERSHSWAPHQQVDNWLDIGAAYVCVLSLPIVDELLAGLSKQIAGGQWYLASKFLDELPLPDLFSSKFNKKVLVDLVRFGRNLGEGRQLERQEIERLTRVLFNG